VALNKESLNTEALNDFQTPSQVSKRVIVVGVVLAPMLAVWSVFFAQRSAGIPFVPDDTPAIMRGKILGSSSNGGEKTVLAESYVVSSERELTNDLGQVMLDRNGKPKTYPVFETRRSYPQNQLGSRLIGFTGDQDKGLYGVELFAHDQLLAGKDVTLTIDPVIQAIAEAALEKAIRTEQGDTGTVVILEAKTNRILAMANYPNFDPNNWRGVQNKSNWSNRALRDYMDPGSTMKGLVAAALIDAGCATPETAVYAPMRRVISGISIGDAIEHRSDLNLKSVLRYSSNVGISKLSEKCFSSQQFHAVLQKYGFGRKVWSTTNWGTSGVLHDWKDWRPIDRATYSFGQGISSTALQLATAYSVLVNEGILITPTLMAGQKVQKSERVISSNAARQTREMLQASVEDGLKFGIVPGFPLGGKTGTAQTWTKSGRISSDVYGALFAGFFPVDRPKVTMLVEVFHPRRLKHGSQVSLPAFTNITRELTSYWQMTPTEASLKASQYKITHRTR
jgi:cell division protein FtsI (penicillin-binding protein 3)